MRNIIKSITVILIVLLIEPLSAKNSFSIDELISLRNTRGDLAARNYLTKNYDINSIPSNADELCSLLLWCVLTGNLCDIDSSYNEEYFSYIDNYLTPFISDGFTLTKEMNDWFPMIYYRYSTLKYQLGDTANAVRIMKWIHSWFEKSPELKNSNDNYPTYLYSMCILICRDQNDYATAMPYLDEALPLMESVFGKYSIQYLDILYFKSIAYRSICQYKLSLSLMTRAIEGYKLLDTITNEQIEKLENELSFTIELSSGQSSTKKIDKKNFSATILQCQQLIMQERSKDALPYLIEIKKKMKEDSIYSEEEYFILTTTLINVYNDIGKIEEAAKLSNLIIDKCEFSHIPDGRLALFYEGTGITKLYLRNFTGAIQDFKSALSLFNKCSITNIELSKTLSNIALCYVGLEDFLNAKWYIDEACEIYESENGSIFDGTPNGITLFSNKGHILSQLNFKEEAEQLYLDGIDFVKDKPLNRSTLDYAYNNLAILYQDQGNWAKSIELLESLNSENPFAKLTFQHNLTIAYVMTNSEKVEQSMVDMGDTTLDTFLNYSTYFTKTEKERLWERQAAELLFINNLIADILPFTTTVAYKNTLIAKGLSNLSDNIFRHTILSSNEGIIKKYDELNNINEKLNQRLSSDSLNYHDLNTKATILERELLAEIPLLKNTILSEIPSYTEIQSRLSDNEAIIEYTIIPRVNDWSKVEDAEINYGAYVITNKLDRPVLVNLCDRDIFDANIDGFDSDRLTISEFYNKDIIYKKIFAPLEVYLKDINTVYCASTGTINSINIGALSTSSGIRIGDKYSVRQVSTSSQIHKSNHFNPRNLVLYGGINYDTSMNDMELFANDYAKQYNLRTPITLRSDFDRGNWSYLPGTLNEINRIRDLVRDSLSTKLYYGEKASEESLKYAVFDKNTILHLATHGFYIRNDEQWWNSPFMNKWRVTNHKDNNLVRTGLLLSGANNIWTGKTTNILKSEDGILTSSEISSLNLEHINLLVLSACETGRGYIDPIDGVYGLTKAFKRAGVDKIVMSLWKIPDEPTSFLMESFYKYLIIENFSVYDSLNMAQKDLIKLGYTDPYYWASFVVLD